MKYEIEVKFNFGFELHRRNLSCIEGRAYNYLNFYHFLYDMTCLKNESMDRMFCWKIWTFIVICEENSRKFEFIPKYNFIHVSAMPCAIVWIETSIEYVYIYSIRVQYWICILQVNPNTCTKTLCLRLEQRQWGFYYKVKRAK